MDPIKKKELEKRILLAKLESSRAQLTDINYSIIKTLEPQEKVKLLLKKRDITAKIKEIELKIGALND